MYFVERKRNMPSRVNERTKRRRPWPWLAAKRESRSFQMLTALWVSIIPFREDGLLVQVGQTNNRTHGKWIGRRISA